MTAEQRAREDFSTEAASTWPPVAPEEVDPVEAWLRRARCCGAPQFCGASCMYDEATATAAAVARRLDEAESAVMASTLEYRVETRGLSSGAWIPEGSLTFRSRTDAEAFRAARADWYGDPDRWSHRITVRRVSGWAVSS